MFYRSHNVDCNNPYDLTKFLQTSFGFEPVYEDDEDEEEGEEY